METTAPLIRDTLRSIVVRVFHYTASAGLGVRAALCFLVQVCSEAYGPPCSRR
jgi:hypothetical protein